MLHQKLDTPNLLIRTEVVLEECISALRCIPDEMRTFTARSAEMDADFLLRSIRIARGDWLEEERAE